MCMETEVVISAKEILFSDHFFVDYENFGQHRIYAHSYENGALVVFVHFSPCKYQLFTIKISALGQFAVGQFAVKKEKKNLTEPNLTNIT